MVESYSSPLSTNLERGWRRLSWRAGIIKPRRAEHNSDVLSYTSAHMEIADESYAADAAHLELRRSDREIGQAKQA